MFGFVHKYLVVAVLFSLLLCDDAYVQAVHQVPNPILPEGISPEKAEEIKRSALESLVGSLYAAQLQRAEHSDKLLRRVEQATTSTCNTIIDTYTAEDLRTDVLQGFIDIGLPDWTIPILNAVVVSRIEQDIQIWKICGRCSDFGPGEVVCREQDYGYQALYSGLLLAPLDASTGKLMETTLPVNIILPAAGIVPTKLWSRPLLDPQMLLGTYVTATAKAYTLLLDGHGYGESIDYYRAFCNKRAIMTSTAALVLQAEKIVSQQSNCRSAMADAYTTFGYSEGGYGAVAVADALDRMGKTVIAVHAGGGPYRISSTTVTTFLQAHRGFHLNYDEGKISSGYFTSLLGGGLSSTTTDAANYGLGQDFLNEANREAIISALQLDVDDSTRQRKINQVVPRNDVLSVLNENLVALYAGAADRGEPEPCVTSVTNTTDKLCEALQDQDLVQELESATYPVYLCHAEFDHIVPIDNLPDLKANPQNLILFKIRGPTLERIRSSTGIKENHAAAAVPCILQAIWYFQDDDALKDFPVRDKTVQSGCPAVSSFEASQGGALASSEQTLDAERKPKKIKSFLCQFAIMRFLGVWC